MDVFKKDRLRSYEGSRTKDENADKKPRVTDNMIEKIDESGKWTEEGSKRCKALKNQLRRATDAAPEKWWARR